jgi:hypothetical protein
VQIDNAQQVATATIFYTDPNDPPGDHVFAIGSFNGNGQGWFSCNACPNYADCTPGALLDWGTRPSSITVTPVTFVSDELVKGKAEWTWGLDVLHFDVDIGPHGFYGIQTDSAGVPSTNWRITAGVTATGELTASSTQTELGTCVFVQSQMTGPPPSHWQP